MNEDEVTEIVRSLAQYLRAHPLACDSASGAAQWWLLPDEASMDVVERALEWLKQCGVLEETAGSDGRTRYRRAATTGRSTRL